MTRRPSRPLFTSISLRLCRVRPGRRSDRGLNTFTFSIQLLCKTLYYVRHDTARRGTAARPSETYVRSAKAEAFRPPARPRTNQSHGRYSSRPLLYSSLYRIITELSSRLKYGNRGSLYYMTFSVVDHSPPPQKNTPDFVETKLIWVGAGSRLRLELVSKVEFWGIFFNIPSRTTGTTREPHQIPRFLYFILDDNESVR